MNTHQKHSKAIAYLRQLCCSGLNKEIVIAEFLRAVQAVIPSGSNVFTGLDAQLNNDYYLPEFVIADLAEVTSEIVSSYFSGERKNRYNSFLKHHLVFAGATLFDELFYKSDLYNLIFQPYDQYHGLWGLVLQSNQPLGVLCLFRPRQQKPFDSHDKILCKQLLPYLAHALQVSEDENNQYCESDFLGMMLMDTNGKIQYLSHEAKNLLALACHPVLTTHAHIQEVELFAKLAQLCRNLQAIFQGQHATPPSWTHTNARGRFMFRTYWLDRFNNEQGNLISMTIEHQEPLRIKILRSLQDLPLSPMQKEVAFILAQGASNEKIGEHLNIKLTTVKDHISKIFDKLNIDSREELLPMLLALDKSKKHEKVVNHNSIIGGSVLKAVIVSESI